MTKEEKTSYNLLTLWIDADACPVVVKEIICRAAQRTKVNTVFCC